MQNTLRAAALFTVILQAACASKGRLLAAAPQDADGDSAVDGGGEGGHPAGCGDTGAPSSYKICARCGDKVCGKGENRCNCPQDCPS